jgi:hypothetical protein
VNDIHLIYPYYCNRNMLRHHVACWNKFPHWMHQYLSIHIVDDGSPEQERPDEELRELKVPNHLARVKVDIPWHQHGARNLAASLMKHDDDWMLMTDMDIGVPESVLCMLLQIRLDRRVHYTFDRRYLDGRPNKPHCNSFLVTKGNYWKAGGYDEDFCGAYGGDGLFLRALAKVAPEHRLSEALIGYDGTVVDANTRGLGRKDTEMHHEYIRRREAKRAANGGQVPRPERPVRFAWEQVW